MTPSFLSTVSPRAALRGSPSIARLAQDAFLAKHGPQLTGTVIEIGGQRRRNHARFFPNVTQLIISNISGDCDLVLDVTNLDLPDNSQQAYVCASVLEHVADTTAAIREMHRTLIPGGILLGAVPFLYPLHDSVDYWRFSPSAWPILLQGFEVRELCHLGGRVSTVVNMLQRGAGRRRISSLVMKTTAVAAAAAMSHCDHLDDSPLAIGFLAIKRP